MKNTRVVCRRFRKISKSGY